MTMINFKQRIQQNLAMLVMIVLVIASAISVVYVKHVSRVEFVALQKLERQRDQLNEEWGRLLLEESTWAGPGQVERQARNKLSMIVPKPEHIVVVEQ